MGIIYKATHRLHADSYVGKTVTTLAHRKYKHKYYALKKNSNCHFYKAIRKYGFDSFDWEVLQEAPDHLLNALEKAWINHFKRNGVRLYNLTDGGDGVLGHRHTDETKAKISATHRGNKYNLGRKLSEERKLKISAQHKGNSYTARIWNVQLLAPDGMIYGPIFNLESFAREHGLHSSHLRSLITGRQQSHKGWRCV